MLIIMELIFISLPFIMLTLIKKSVITKLFATRLLLFCSFILGIEVLVNWLEVITNQNLAPSFTTLLVNDTWWSILLTPTIFISYLLVYAEVSE